MVADGTQRDLAAAVGGTVLHAPGLSGGGDIDVVVDGLDPWWPLRLTDSRLCQSLRYDVTGWYWVMDRGGEIIALDTLVDPLGRGKYAFVPPSGHAANDLVDPSTRAAYLALKRLRKDDRRPEVWASLASSAASDPGKFRSLLVASLGPAGRALAETALGGVPPTNHEWRRLRRLQRLHRIRGPAGAARLAVEMLARWLHRISHPTGLTVVIAGADGCGKSSVAPQLVEACRGLFRRELRMHWRPFVLPSPGCLVGSDARNPAHPHAAPPHGAVTSAVRLCYFFADFLLGELLRVGPARIRTGLVVTERGWWDMVVDPRRYRLGSPNRVTAALGRFMPGPDLLFVLDAPTEVLVSRKQELPAEELERQRRAWLELGIPGAEKVVLDATKPLDQVVADAREAIVAHLERRAVARLGAGWANLPSRTSTRWWLPRSPRPTAVTGVGVYQPVTAKGRAGWELARFLARAGGFRLLPRGEAPPREVRARLAEHLPRRTTYAVMRANHPGRYVALIVGQDGAARAVAKVATTSEAEERLRQEARAIERWGPLFPAPVRAPRIIGEGKGVLVLEAAPFRPRLRPWLLDPAVAAALGALEREGVSHGDAAPWNLLETPEGFVLVDWESAGPASAPGWDLWHWLVQSHALLGRPRRVELLESLRGAGRLGGPVRVFLRAAGLEGGDLAEFLRTYLVRSREGLDPSTPDGQRGIVAREALLRELDDLARRGV